MMKILNDPEMECLTEGYFHAIIPSKKEKLPYKNFAGRCKAILEPAGLDDRDQ